MGFPSGVPVLIHQHGYDTDKLQLPVEHGDALWAVILDSPRESRHYQSALAALLSTDHEQKLLYTLSDRSAIEEMLTILEIVSTTHARSHSTRTCS